MRKCSRTIQRYCTVKSTVITSKYILQYFTVLQYCKLGPRFHLIFLLVLKQYCFIIISYIPFTFVVNLETNGANAFIRLKMKPHLIGHADNEVRNKAARQPDKTHAYESDI